MANFRQHLIYGAVVSSLGAIAGFTKFGLSAIQSAAALVLGTLASLAPDIDHSESIPGRIFFELLGIIMPLSMVPFIPEAYIRNFVLEHWLLYFFAGYVLVRYLLFFVFERLTVHRGIFHSLPAAAISGQIIFLLFFHLPLPSRLALAVVVTCGYLTHLVADECYSIDWSGNEFKQSFGTAIDIGNFRYFSTWIAYGTMLILFGCIWQKMTGQAIHIPFLGD